MLNNYPALNGEIHHKIKHCIAVGAVYCLSENSHNKYDVRLPLLLKITESQY